MTTRVHMPKVPAVPEPAAPARSWLALAVLCVTLLMVTLGGTVIALIVLPGGRRKPGR